MPAPAVLAFLFGALSPPILEVATGADTEFAAGRAPLAVGLKEVNSTSITLVPGLGLRLQDPTQSIAVSYTPRLFYRLPNQFGVDRPLVLHQVSLEHASDLDRRSKWATRAELSAGEVEGSRGS